MTFSTINFDALTPLAPKFPNFAVQILLFRMKHTVAVVMHTCTCATKFLHHLATGCWLPKTTFRTKIGGGWARKTSKNLGPTIYFCNRWSEQLQIWYTTWVRDYLTIKRRLGPKLAGSGTGEHPKNLGPPTYFCKRWDQLTKKRRLRPTLAGVWVGEHQKNLGPTIYFCNRWSSQLRNWYTTWVQVYLAKHKF